MLSNQGKNFTVKDWHWLPIKLFFVVSMTTSCCNMQSVWLPITTLYNFLYIFFVLFYILHMLSFPNLTFAVFLIQTNTNRCFFKLCKYESNSQSLSNLSNLFPTNSSYFILKKRPSFKRIYKVFQMTTVIDLEDIL